MAKTQEYRDQTADEVKALVNDTRRDLYHLVNARKKEAKERKTHLTKQKKRDLARMLTVLREKEVAEKSKMPQGKK